jgi:MOSC domain-containing protein YiiM
MPKLVSIVYRPIGPSKGDYGFTRVPLLEAQLIAGYGIEGDAKGGTDDRHLNILSSSNLQTLEQDGYKTRPGEIGEQLILDGVDVEQLPSGTRLSIGETAQVELVKLRTGCTVFEGHQGKSREGAAGRLGMMAKVVTGGAIRVGDPVRVEEPAVI